jgi:redox-sensing transcriptional repressor
MSDKNLPNQVSANTLRRLPYYLNYLKTLKNTDVSYISAPVIASELDLNEVQVRKDLAAISSVAGKPKKGFEIDVLINDIQAYIGCDVNNCGILVGAGHLGRALLAYSGFEAYGLNIIAAFDSNPAAVGKDIAGKSVYHTDALLDFCKKTPVTIGIITVPAEDAQEICDLLIKANVKAIWNFAPVKLCTPDGVIIQNENIAASLTIINKKLAEQF